MDREKVKSAIVEISLSVEPFQGTRIEPTAINFFYGKNGSGKTSISRAIMDGGALTWKATEPESDYDRLVFNRDFIQQNLMLHDRMPGVFTISEADIAVQGEIKKKSEEKKQLDAKVATLGEQLTTKKGEAFVEKTIFTDSCWNISKTARTLGGSIVTQSLDEITDELKGVRGCEQVTNVINPFWVVLRGLVTNLKFILQRAIGDNNTLFIEL